MESQRTVGPQRRRVASCIVGQRLTQSPGPHPTRSCRWVRWLAPRLGQVPRGETAPPSCAGDAWLPVEAPWPVTQQWPCDLHQDGAGCEPLRHGASPPFECHVRSRADRAGSARVQRRPAGANERGRPRGLDATRIVTCWSCAGCLTCLGALNQVDVPPRDGVDQQTGHDALRENARTGLKQREKPPEPVGFEVIRGHHAKTRLASETSRCAMEAATRSERACPPPDCADKASKTRPAVLLPPNDPTPRTIPCVPWFVGSIRCLAEKLPRSWNSLRQTSPGLWPIRHRPRRKPAALTEVDDVLHGLKPTTVLARTGVKTDLVNAVSDAPRPEPNHQESHLSPRSEHPRQGL